MADLTSRAMKFKLKLESDSRINNLDVSLLTVHVKGGVGNPSGSIGFLSYPFGNTHNVSLAYLRTVSNAAEFGTIVRM